MNVQIKTIPGNTLLHTNPKRWVWLYGSFGQFLLVSACKLDDTEILAFIERDIQQGTIPLFLQEGEEPSLRDTVQSAIKWHYRQVNRKSGEPYIEHPLRVAHRLKKEKDKKIAALHDVLEDCNTEDCNVSREDLKQLGYSNEDVTDLETVTKQEVEFEDYPRFTARIVRGSARSIRVKITDLLDNMDLSRIKELTERDLTRTEKYREALRTLWQELLRRNVVPEEYFTDMALREIHSHLSK